VTKDGLNVPGIRRNLSKALSQNAHHGHRMIIAPKPSLEFLKKSFGEFDQNILLQAELAREEVKHGLGIFVL